MGSLRQVGKEAPPDLGVMVSLLTWCRHQAGDPPAATFVTPPVIGPRPCAQPRPGVRWVLPALGAQVPSRAQMVECSEAAGGGD